MTTPNSETELAGQELTDEYGPDISPDYKFQHLDDHVVLEAEPRQERA